MLECGVVYEFHNLLYYNNFEFYFTILKLISSKGSNIFICMF